MPPTPLTLSSLTRSRSLNRPRGALNATVTESPESPRHYFSRFRNYTGASSQEPCAKRALIVSIEYRDGQTFADGRSMGLPGCHADAADVLELLRTNGEYLAQDIQILADVPGLPSSQKPTRENIIRGLRWLASGCLAGDRRFFHYAGHGTQVEDLDGDEEDGFDEAIQPLDWSTKYRRGNDGLIIDDDFRELLVDRLPRGSTLTALVDCCHSGTILDMEQETSPKLSRLPMPRGSVPSIPSKAIYALTLKLKWPKCREGVCPVGNILELPELARVKDSDEPVSPGADRGPITASEYVVLEKKSVESPTKRTYLPIVANVVCWSACLDSQLAWSQPQEVSDDRGVLTSAFTTGMRGAAANYNAMPGAFNTEKRDATYAELFDYILIQERTAYEERKNFESIAQFYQDPQLWISASMGDIMDRPVII
ncbi:hypothetical protein BDV93DRAFT_522508 [Ceratobasidium sp. AG-I]|nr:hypothetical protein BDV93DRAFT_522508 [Ceratobasidium sp. AG-I]